MTISKDDYIYVPNPIIQPPLDDNHNAGQPNHGYVEYNGQYVRRFEAKIVKVASPAARNPAASWQPRVSVTMDLALNPAYLSPYNTAWEASDEDTEIDYGPFSDGQRQLGSVISRIAKSGTCYCWCAAAATTTTRNRRSTCRWCATTPVRRCRRHGCYYYSYRYYCSQLTNDASQVRRSGNT